MERGERRERATVTRKRRVKAGMERGTAPMGGTTQEPLAKEGGLYLNICAVVPPPRVPSYPLLMGPV